MRTSAVQDQIPVVKSTGTGGTTLSAFHEALVAVDLGHYNLLRLSSVIPPATAVDPTGKAQVPVGEWGDKMYCVYAAQFATTMGRAASKGPASSNQPDTNGSTGWIWALSASKKACVRGASSSRHSAGAWTKERSVMLM